MHPMHNSSNPAADAATTTASSSMLSASNDHRQKMVWSPQPQYNYTNHHQQPHSFQSPTQQHDFYYNHHANNNNNPSYSTPRVQSEPPTSPPRIQQTDLKGGAPSNLSMMSSIEETSSTIMDQPLPPLSSFANRKLMMLTQAASTTDESATAERREEVVDTTRARTDSDDGILSRVASPTLPPRENLPPKKRKAMSKESVLLMEIDKLKGDLSKAMLKIQVLEEENERLKQQRDDNEEDGDLRLLDVSSKSSQLPFIPDLPGGQNTSSSPPGNGSMPTHNEKHHHQNHVMKQQQLHSIYRVPSSPSSLQRQYPQDAFGSSHHHHRDVNRPLPYHPYPAATTAMRMDKYDRQHVHRDRGWIMPPNNHHVANNTTTNTTSTSTTSPSTETHKKISFALSFDATTKSSSNKDSSSRGYNRCVSNRGRGSRPPLASRWKSR